MFSIRCFRGAACAALLLGAIPAQAGRVDLVSRRDPGFLAPELIGEAQSSVVLSADGRWAAFTSTAVNLVAGQNDANTGTDIFLLDRQSGTIALVSHSGLSPVTTGSEASDSPSISADGRFVVFRSLGMNLVPGQTEPGFAYQVYVYDRDTGVLSLASHKAGAAASPGNSSSSGARISRDGGSVVFMSQATDLVNGVADANQSYDVFVYDVAGGTVDLVSHTAASTTTTGSGLSWLPWVSADGRFLLFESQATDLVSGQTDTASTQDVFLHDRTAGITVLVSRAAGSSTTTASAVSSARGLSDDGAYAVFLSQGANLVPGQADTAFTDDVFLFERATGAVTLVSHANGAPATAVGGFGSIGGDTISGDGAWVVFSSSATNVVPGQADANAGFDVFLLQRATGATTLVSYAAGSATTTGAGGSFPYRLSDDGRSLLFGSFATDLVSGQTDTNGVQDAFLYDRVAGTTVLVTHVQGSSTTASATAPDAATLSADGAWAAFTSTSSNLTAETDPGNRDLFLYERASGANLSFTYGQPLIRQTPDGFSGFDQRGVNQNGRYLAIASRGTDLVPGQVDTNNSNEVFLIDRIAGVTTLVSHTPGSPATASNGFSTDPAISADGAWLAFDSTATDLTSGLGTTSPYTSNVFLWNRDSGALTLVSRRASDPGLSGNGPSVSPVISADGRYVAFSSLARNLVTSQIDTTNTGDVFLYDRVTGDMALASHQAGDPVRATNGSSSLAQKLGMTPDGRWILFPSRGTSLVSGQIDTNAGDDLFLYDRTTGDVILVSRSASSPATAGNAASPLLYIPAISPDGRYVAFLSPATDLVAGQVDTNGQDDLFLYDRLSGTVTLISHQDGIPATAGNGRSALPFFSEDGLYLLFSSASNNLVPGQSLVRRGDPFLYDLSTGTLSLLPVGAGPQLSGSTAPLGASAGARTVLLQSTAVDLIPGQVDMNAAESDLFLVDRLTGATKLVSQIPSSPLATGNNVNTFGLLRNGGNLVVFSSYASDLAPGDFNRTSDMFVYTAGAAPASDYYTVTPCRALDTRSASPLSSGVKSFAALHGVCGVPDTAVAVAVNITVLGATGSGNLKVYPADVDPPASSSINFQAGVTRANNAMLPLAYDGAGTLGLLATIAGMSGGGTVHVILDVVGYFQ
jgi:Tol biopolymer transport system component